MWLKILRKDATAELFILAFVQIFLFLYQKRRESELCCIGFGLFSKGL